MKLNAIRKQCLQSKQFIIIDAPDGTQLLSNGANAYRIVGIRLRPDVLPDLFNLTEKQAEKCLFIKEKRADVTYNEEYRFVGEEVTHAGTVWMYQTKIAALRTEDALMYVPTDALLAAGDELSDMRLIRDADGLPRIAVLRGIFCEALLTPLDEAIAQNISETLVRIGGMPILMTKPRREVESDEITAANG